MAQENAYSFRAELPENASLKVVFAKSAESEGSWMYPVGDEIGWDISNTESGATQFTAVGPADCDLKIMFSTGGTADLSIYENGSEEPTRVITIS
ncbi:MAG: hypothetical protein JW801_14605 [Bacteroidales bacterium]|nr:hypothetical protein [Bacteroidales bacterium]